MHCTQRLPGRHTLCGHTLDADNQCERCRRRAAGQCWACGQPRSNSARRGLLCRPCAADALIAAQLRYAAKPETKARRHDRAIVVNQRPEVRARRARLMYAWRHAKPERLRRMAEQARRLYSTRVQHRTGAIASREHHES